MHVLHAENDANGKYDEAGEWMIWSFAIFFVMWYLSFATDLNLHLFTVGTPFVILYHRARVA